MSQDNNDWKNNIDWALVMKKISKKGMEPNTRIISPQTYFKHLEKSSLFSIDPETYDLWKQTAELGPIDWDKAIARMIEAMKK